MTPYQKGLLITGFGGLVLTVDIPMIRLAGGDVWSAQFARSALGLLVAAICWIGLMIWRKKPVRLLPKNGGLLVAFFYGLSAVAFISAVFNTTTANLVFILTTITIFSALLGWWFLGERPKAVTILTMFIMVGCIFLIASDGIAAGNYFGDFCALAASFFLSCGQIVARKSGENMGFAPMLGGLLPTVVAAIVLMSRGGIDAFYLDAPIWIILNGAFIIPIAFWCLATGPQYLTGAEVGMFYLLETVLAPVWVWYIFQELPTTNTLIGGSVLVTVLLCHSLWQLDEERRRKSMASDTWSKAE